VESIAAIAKEYTLLVPGPNLLYECGNAGISSRRTIDCLTTQSEHLLVEIKIGVAVVQLHNGERISVFHHGKNDLQPGSSISPLQYHFLLSDDFFSNS
jgi:hypothetical protein